MRMNSVGEVLSWYSTGFQQHLLAKAIAMMVNIKVTTKKLAKYKTNIPRDFKKRLSRSSMVPHLGTLIVGPLVNGLLAMTFNKTLPARY